ncbi:MAG: hypothetical protein AB7F98_17845 [Novosphingobium sp.]
MTAAALATHPAGSGAAPRPVLLNRSVQFVWFLIFAMATRWYALGDLNYQEDELLFFYYGQRMHEGLLPYVDLWDRKPPSLFLLYYFFAGISHSVYVYQIAGLLSVAMTAQVIALLCERIGARVAGGTLAGTLYLCMLLEFGGAGGQAPIFYNLPMAVAALLVISRRDSLAQGKTGPALFAAMLLAGLAITFKQTAVFEAAFLGCYALFVLARGGMPQAKLVRTGLAMMLTGAVPMLAWALFYAVSGHFYEFWHAMVLSNFTRSYHFDANLVFRARVFTVALGPVLLIAAAGLAGHGQDVAARVGRNFVIGWLVAAFAGFLVIPNLIDHYVMPLMVPLAIATSPLLSRRPIGWIAGVVMISLYVAACPALDPGRASRSRSEVMSLIQEMHQRDPVMRLFVFDGPVYLNVLTGSNPPTPLAFPLHLAALPERNVSHLDTAGEVRKILAWRPTTVVLQKESRPVELENAETNALVRDYVSSQCRSHYARRIHDMYGKVDLDLYTDCAGNAAARP